MYLKILFRFKLFYKLIIFNHIFSHNEHATSLIQSHNLLEWTCHIINLITQFVTMDMPHHQFSHIFCQNGHATSSIQSHILLDGHATSSIQSHSLLKLTCHIINSVTQFFKMDMPHHQFNHIICQNGHATSLHLVTQLGILDMPLWHCANVQSSYICPFS